jgi:hypothetical protein
MILNFKKRGGLIHFLFIAIITLATLLIFWRPIFNKGVLLYSDNIPPVLNMNSFNKTANYIFTEKYMGLTENPIHIVTYFFIEKLFYLIGLFVNKETLSLLWVILPSIFFNITLYFVFFQFVKKKRAAFLQTLLFIFSLTYFDSLFMGGPLTIWSHIGSLLFFTFFVKYVNEQKNEYLILASIFSILGVLNIAYFYCALLACSFFLVLYFIIYKINLLNFFKKRPFLILFIIITILIHFFWLLPYIMSVYKKLTNYGGSDDNLFFGRSLISTPLNNFQFAYAFRPEPTYSKPYYLYKTIIYQITNFSFLFISLFYLIKEIKKNKKILLLFCLFLIFFTISLGNNFPLRNLLAQIPGWFFLRDHMRVLLFSYFIYVLLIGYIITEKSTFFKKFIVLYICFNAIIFFKSDMFGFFSNSVIPNNYVEVVKYLSKDTNKDKSILILPEFNWYIKYKWMGGNFYTPVVFEWLNENPIIMSFIGRSRIPDYFKAFLDKKIKKDHYAQYLGKGGVKYITLHKDGLNFNYSMNREIENLDKTIGIKKVVSGENIDLYEISDKYYLPMIYSSTDLKYKKINPSKYEISIHLKDKSRLIFNFPYNPNWNIFLDNKNLDKKCQPLENIVLSTKTIEGSNKDSNVKTVVCKTNQTFLESSEDFLYMAVKPLFENTHKTAYNYANEWVLDARDIKESFNKNYYVENPDGSITVNLVLFYKPQSYFYLSIVISSLACLSCLMFLFFSNKKNNQHWD